MNVQLLAEFFEMHRCIEMHVSGKSMYKVCNMSTGLTTGKTERCAIFLPATIFDTTSQVHNAPRLICNYDR